MADALDLGDMGAYEDNRKPPSQIPNRDFAPSPFRVDEGYSEDPRNQIDSDSERDPIPIAIDSLDHVSQARQWLLAQPVDLRAGKPFRPSNHFELILSLPNAAVSQLVFEANLRLHFDPVKCLPQEIITHILEYLPARALSNASLVSKLWRHRALDPKLWRRLFTLEGWTFNSGNVREFEEQARRGKGRKSRTHEASPERHSNKKFRGMESSVDEQRFASSVPDADGSMDLPEMWLDLAGGSAGQRWDAATPSLGRSPSDSGSADPGDLEMRDAPPNRDINNDSPALRYPMQGVVNLPSPSINSASQRLFITDPIFARPVSNWHHLYNQRRRLEKNWYAGRFTNFRLPQPEHMDEAHSQCVYTLQYSANYLVSGSRDKSVRIWDLSTKRLRLPPLIGHEGSVLCLQFDERPQQDALITGGSDSDIIIWKFSTGEMIKRMKRAHDESVLNLRFDDRYLVTCSKDKSIKIWSRRFLRPTDPVYPNRTNARNAVYPNYIVDLQQLSSGLSSPINTPLDPYSLLMTLEGHNAAVNAIQILGDEIVSASGDRKIMLWNIKNGTLTRAYPGHTKGIACVQYDGRRIVSGSSDCTVRIFDSSTTAELATLEGHRNLVRTVQAQFGDFNVDAATLEAQARESDRQITENQGKSQSGYFVKGAKLPPGGGGTPWAKIVSGSYDETVIIWRRDRQGRWYIAKELRHEEAIRVASGQSPRPPSQRLRTQQTYTPQQMALRRRVLQLRQQQMQQNPSQMMQGPSQTQQAGAAGPAGGWPMATQAGSDVAGQQMQQSQNLAQAVGQGQSLDAATLQTLQQQQSQLSALQDGNRPSSQDGNAGPSHPFGSQAPPTMQNVGQTTAQPPQTNANAHPHALAAAAAAAQHAAQQGIAGAGGPQNRVFKLQFDARRIVCCSQEPVIIGWDFANGDTEIEEASKFFEESY